ncbi:hypothetical protein MI149_30105 (plasmid) [Mycolicibacterium crocinum]|uniref:Uncharacterized protein n=1 Tax=Mycolicibacterium crocinum TaxID=388459 RepID=A0ABY3TYK7_9MYCO|nr:hypothetical protein [Mycolicibacterium crocinum]ULN44750.1 hypothetical protein MI149_30105 [Mycolicibacterium crocinum]
MASDSVVFPAFDPLHRVAVGSWACGQLRLGEPFHDSPVTGKALVVLDAHHGVDRGLQDRHHRGQDADLVATSLGVAIGQL